MTDDAKASLPDPESFAETFAATCRALSRLLADDNRDLAAGNLPAVAARVDEKMALTRAYEEAYLAVGRAPELTLQLGGATRQDLKGLIAALEPLAAENARRLKAAVEVNRRFMEVVADAVRAVSTPAKTYGADGAFAGPRRTGAPQSVAISLDRSL